MKVLVLANNDVGLYKFRKELLECLISDGHDVYISLPDGEFINLLKKMGCRFIETKVDRRGMNPFSDIRLFLDYLSIIRHVSPDFVLTYTVKPNIYGGIACIVCKKKYIENITGMGTAIENKGILSHLVLLLYKLALRNSACVFFQNAANQSFFVNNRIVRGKNRLIPGSGVDLIFHSLEPYPHTEEFSDKFLFVGRIVKSKGMKELFEAAERIHKEYPTVRFDIVGGQDEDYGEKLSSLEKKGVLRYWGQQSDVRPYMRDCNAIVHPAYYEGLANVLLEAASTGRPVLASNVPGCMEAFDEGVSGLGFEAKSTESLYKVLKRFVLLPIEMKSSMGEAGREKMEKEFDRKIVVRAYIEEIYGKEE